MGVCRNSMSQSNSFLAEITNVGRNDGGNLNLLSVRSRMILPMARGRASFEPLSKSFFNPAKCSNVSSCGIHDQALFYLQTEQT